MFQLTCKLFRFEGSGTTSVARANVTRHGDEQTILQCHMTQKLQLNREGRENSRSRWHGVRSLERSIYRTWYIYIWNYDMSSTPARSCSHMSTWDHMELSVDVLICLGDLPRQCFNLSKYYSINELSCVIFYCIISNHTISYYITIRLLLLLTSPLLLLLLLLLLWLLLLLLLYQSISHHIISLHIIS